MSSEIEWAEPPAEDRGRKHAKAREFALALKERPGEWAIYVRNTSRSRASAQATYLKQCYGLESVTRGANTNVTVYARYVNGTGK